MTVSTSLSLPQLDAILDRLPQLTIGLIGDLFLDRYFEIDPNRTEPSIETGLDAYQVVRIRNQAGALGTVMNNLAALGVGRLVPITVIGTDGLGVDLLHSLCSLPLESSGIIRSDERLTPTYLKPLVVRPGRPPQELNRLDVRTRVPLSPALRQELCSRLEKWFTRVDGWIVLDQIDQVDEGVVHHEVRAMLGELSRRAADIPLLVDSRRQLALFEFGSLKGNRNEFTWATGCEEPAAAATQLARRSGRPAYATCGDEGIWVGDPDGATTLVPTRRVSGPIDIVGAGDSATAGLLCALLCGLDPANAAAFANLVASITIRQLGTTGTASPQELRQAMGGDGVS